MESKKNSLLSIPGAIIIAAAILAVAWIWTQKPVTINNGGAGANVPATPQVAQANIAPVSSDDHIFGNPNAPIKLVEFSDPSCPFCKMFNPTMEQVMNDYGPSGKVVWIYRQFPLDKPDQNGNVLHPLAGVQAEGMECAAALGGNDAFWKYEKAWFDAFPSDGADEASSLDQSQMLAVASSIGLDKTAFNDCVSSKRFADRIEKQYLDGLNAGVSGTPFTVIVSPSGMKIPMAGAQSYQALKTAIDALLSEAPGAPSAASTSAAQ